MTDTTTPQYTPRTIHQVAELNAMVRELLAYSFNLLWVEGEISNLARPRSGHVYFTLKDDDAQVRCALFRGKARLLDFAPDSGARVLVRARVGLYAVRGDYQLIIEHMEPAGAGALQRAFEQLKKRLDAEGLFDPARKLALPAAPARIGVITSATGAALRDVLSVLARRFPLAAVRLYPVPVQGAAAPQAIVTALQRAAQRADCDVLLLVRGGGSLEDLQAFNDEDVARAVAACGQPLVAGVGHETDFTIVDFVADMRAPTPSAAAELVCPDMDARRERLGHHLRRLETSLRRQLAFTRRHADSLQQRLRRQHPRRRVEEAMQRLDDIELRLQRAVQQHMTASRQKHEQLQGRLLRVAPRQRISHATAHHARLQQRLQRAVRQRLATAAQRLTAASHALDTVSPLRTLDRGYAIARTQEQRILRDARTVTAGDTVSVLLHRGRLDCRVHSIHSGANTRNGTSE